MSLSDAFIPIEKKNKEIVMSNTWGHLFPQNSYYEGSITIARGVYSEIIILKEELDIDGSPWWYNSIHEFIDELIWDIDSGEIYKIKIVVNIDTITEDSDTSQIIRINELNHNKINI